MSKPLLTFYGDDLTGSTDAMEALSLNGVRTVLFTRVPSAADLEAFAGYQAIGLAGASRSETPQWMEQHLAPALSWLRSLGGDLCHYKVCSTFDSSPAIGSIGKAIEIGRAVFSQNVTPIIVGVPQLRRFTCFGHLFAAYQGVVYRIDRHPVMSRHPVTPMLEADLAVHLSKQTPLAVDVVSYEALQGSEAERAYGAALDAAKGALLIDVIDRATQKIAGEFVWNNRERTGAFLVGSSGVEYALIQAWLSAGLIDGKSSFAAPGPVDRLAVVSGSVSPMTERQIDHALAHGFHGVTLDPLALAGKDQDQAIRIYVSQCLEILKSGRSVVAYTAKGPSSDRGHDIKAHGGSRHAIGRALGRIQKALIQEGGLKRVVIAGGDTSSHALQELDFTALTTCHPLPKTPGSPLCVAHSGNRAFDGLQIAFKGGQLGGEDYFAAIRDGRMTS